MDYKQWIDFHMAEEIGDLKGLLRIPSVSRGEPKGGMPLGENVHRALHYTLDLANRLGFSNTRSLDGYCGLVEFGEGEELLMIMAHLDVVPAGTGWESDPFEPVEKNGRLIARGVLDDKGPAVAALYAMAAVKAAGVPMRRRVRLFLGCDEELEWACVDRYKETEELPTMGFTPDGNYPLVNSEMGICQTTFHRALADMGLRIDCGTAPNVVPGQAKAELPFPAVPCVVPAGFTAEFSGNTISVTGRGGHAAHPEDAANALLCLLALLAAQPFEGEAYAALSGLGALLDFDQHGEGFGLDIQDKSGHLTLSPDILRVDDGGITLTLDCRYPFSCAFEHLAEKQDAALAALGFVRTNTVNKAGHFIPEDSELVDTLLGIYEVHIGHKAQPMSIGGGTYARAFPNAVAFGADPEGSVSECHMPNESMALSDIRFNTEVMAEAIAKLAGKPQNS